MILHDVSSSLRVHRSSAANGVRYPFTTSLQKDRRRGGVSHTHEGQQNTQFTVNKIILLGQLQKVEVVAMKQLTQ